MLISRVINVFSLAVTLCAFQDAARAFEEPRNQPEPGQPQEPINIRPTVDNIYWMLFEPDDVTTLTVDQVKYLVIKAIALLRSPANRYEPSTPEDAPAVVYLFDLFHEVVEEHGTNYCDNDKLVRIKVLEAVFGNHHNFGPFLQHFNVRRFEVCSMELIKKMETSRIHFRDSSRERFLHLNQLTELVTQRRKELIEEDIYSIEDSDDEDESSLRNTSVSLMQYMADTLKMDIEKPRGKPMVEQLNYIGQLEEELFYDECEDLGSLHGQDYGLYQLFIAFYRGELRHLFWQNEVVADLLDKLRICHQLTYGNIHIYMLGQYDFGDLIHRITDTEESDRSPEEMADLLEIAIFSAQAELYLGHDHSAIANYYIELLVVSQVRSEKCDIHYIWLVKDLFNAVDDNPNLRRYMNHYIHLQVLECLPKFHVDLSNSIGSIELERVFELTTLYNIFRDVTRQIQPSLRLYYDRIPPIITRLSAGKIFDTLGFNLFTLQRSDLQRLPEIQDKIQSLFRDCRVIIQNLTSTFNMFKLFIELDERVTSRIDEEQVSWMSKYNLCRTVVNLSSEPPTMPFANLTI